MPDEPPSLVEKHFSVEQIHVYQKLGQRNRFHYFDSDQYHLLI